jgi:hypothetical protein
MLEIEDYYGIDDDIRKLDRWQREFNIPPTEVAPDHLRSERKSALGAGIVGPHRSWD